MKFSNYEDLKEKLIQTPKKWFLTGAAGFIGSNLLQELLELKQEVVAIDNFSNGHRSNLDDVKSKVLEKKWKNLSFYEGDFTNSELVNKLCKGVDYVLHQGALGSVPRSIKDPIRSNHHNVGGQLSVLEASKNNGVQKVVYASSSSVYGDHSMLPKIENTIGKQLSPYAVSKYVNELYAKVFFDTYELSSIGLRYFNVFGRRQSPEGAYAAVIPLWLRAMIRNEELFINGDGETSRDFCYVKNVIQANIQAAVSDTKGAEVYNIACNDQTTLNQLFNHLKDILSSECGIHYKKMPVYKPFREGDIRHSRADIKKAKEDFKYWPKYKIQKGLEETIHWYVSNLK